MQNQNWYNWSSEYKRARYDLQKSISTARGPIPRNLWATTCGRTTQRAFGMHNKQVLRALSSVDPCKAVGPNHVVSRGCTEQLPEEYTDIFKTPLLQVKPHTFQVLCDCAGLLESKRNNDRWSHGCAFTATAMKCLEKLFLTHFNIVVPDMVEPYQFAYRPNRSVDDADARATPHPLTSGR